MRTRHLAVACTAALVVFSASPAQSLIAFASDRGGNYDIYTMDPEHPKAKAVAVSGSEIVAVGTRSEIEPRVGESTRVVELGDRALVPGFIDAHGHLGLVVQTLDLPG